MNTPYPEETSHATNDQDTSPPPQYSLHEPSRPPRPNGNLTRRAQQISLSIDNNVRHPTASSFVLDGESTNCWSDEFTASAVLSLLQKEPLSPLPRLVTHNDIASENTPLLTCVVCFETFRHDSFPNTPITAGCDHTSTPGTHICLGCLRRSLDNQLSSSDTTSPLACPLCNHKLSDEEVHRWASRQTFQTYDRMRTWQLLEEDAEFVPCIRQNCGYGQLHAGGLEDPVVVCRSCGTRTCFIHRQAPWHEGMTCTEYEEMTNPRDNEIEIEQLCQNQARELSHARRPSNDTVVSALSGFTRSGTLEWATWPCPGCSSPTGRPSGGELCWHEWCWDCGIGWKPGHLDANCVLSPL